MKIDFNTLVILNAVVESCSMSTAAQRLSISPSSVTYAINKIRKFTGNPIFIRSNSGVRPTALAYELNDRYKKTVIMINEVIGGENDKNTPPIPKTFTISTYTYLEFWISLMATKGDGIISENILNFKSHPKDSEKRLVNLRNREVDFDIGSQLPTDPSIISYLLFRSDFKAMVSNSHSSIKDQLTMDDWYKNHHIAWNRIYDEASSMMGDSSMAKEMQERIIRITSHSSLNMMMICSNSDLIMMIPEFFCCCIDEILPVKFFDIPFENKMEASIYIHTHTKSLKNPHAMALINAILNKNC